MRLNKRLFNSSIMIIQIEIKNNYKHDFLKSINNQSVNLSSSKVWVLNFNILIQNFYDKLTDNQSIVKLSILFLNKSYLNDNNIFRTIKFQLSERWFRRLHSSFKNWFQLLLVIQNQSSAVNDLMNLRSNIISRNINSMMKLFLQIILIQRKKWLSCKHWLRNMKQKIAII